MTQSFTVLVESCKRATEHWELTSMLSIFSAAFSYAFGLNNAEIMLILAMMLGVDTVLGSALAVRRRKFTALGMGKAISKVIIYGCFLIMAHLSELLIENGSGTRFGLLDLSAYYFLILREAKSSNEKLALMDLPIPFNPFARVERLFAKFAEEIEK